MVIKEDIYLSCFNTMRSLHIYLPDDYDTSHKRYAVMYMFDGHNLFYDQDATYGKCWGLKKYLDTHPKIDIIIVGIECNHEGFSRLEEFSPYDFTDPYAGKLKGRGKPFMDWVIQELKPWVDTTFRTKVSRTHTAIGGSSMGGLMALYTILHHSDVFSKAACLSPFLFPVKKDMDKELKQDFSINTKVYLSWGSDEFRTKLQLAKATDYMLHITRDLYKKGLDVYPNQIIKGAHNEVSWEKEVSVFIPFLFDIK